MEPKETKRTFRWWFITKNNPPEDWIQWLKNLEATYTLGQLEKGENGTPHVQAVLYFVDAKRPTHWKGILCWAKGISQADALLRVTRYCSKAETRIDGPFEDGIKPKSLSKGVDWKEAKELAKKGDFDNIEASIYIRYFGNLKKIHFDASRPYTADKIRGLWIYGQPGYGKSHMARDIGANSLYVKPQNKWFDGYGGEEVILLDDLDANGACLGHYIKIWADKWACSGEIKGGTVALQHKCFIITSNYLPGELWAKDDMLVSAITRRFMFVIFYSDRKYVTGEEIGQIPVVPFDL